MSATLQMSADAFLALLGGIFTSLSFAFAIAVGCWVARDKTLDCGPSVIQQEQRAELERQEKVRPCGVHTNARTGIRRREPQEARRQAAPADGRRGGHQDDGGEEGDDGATR